VERQKKARPAAFMDVDRASAIEIGNTEDDLARLADCDLVVEAIIEKPEPKQALYERLEKLLPAHAIIASACPRTPANSASSLSAAPASPSSLPAT